MPTNNPRINITLKQKTVNLLTKIARKEDKSVSSLVKELMLEALDQREDVALSAIAAARDVEGVPRVGHDQAWDD